MISWSRSGSLQEYYYWPFVNTRKLANMKLNEGLSYLRRTTHHVLIKKKNHAINYKDGHNKARIPFICEKMYLSFSLIFPKIEQILYRFTPLSMLFLEIKST